MTSRRRFLLNGSVMLARAPLARWFDLSRSGPGPRLAMERVLGLAAARPGG